MVYKDLSGAKTNKDAYRLAAPKNNAKESEVFLDQKRDFEEKFDPIKSASQYALARDAEGLRRVVSRGGDLEDAAPGGRSAVGIAARWGFEEGLAILLNAGADPNARQGAGGATPLVLAMRAQQDGCVELLLRAGADPDLSDVSGWTPLLIACKQAREEWASKLLPLSRLEVRARDGSSALGLARAAGLKRLAGEIEARLSAESERDELESASRAGARSAYPPRI